MKKVLFEVTALSYFHLVARPEEHWRVKLPVNWSSAEEESYWSNWPTQLQIVY